MPLLPPTSEPARVLEATVGGGATRGSTRTVSTTKNNNKKENGQISSLSVLDAVNFANECYLCVSSCVKYVGVWLITCSHLCAVRPISSSFVASAPLREAASNSLNSASRGAFSESSIIHPWQHAILLLLLLQKTTTTLRKQCTVYIVLVEDHLPVPFVRLYSSRERNDAPFVIYIFVRFSLVCIESLRQDPCGLHRVDLMGSEATLQTPDTRRMSLQQHEAGKERPTATHFLDFSFHAHANSAECVYRCTNPDELEHFQCNNHFPGWEPWAAHTGMRKIRCAFAAGDIQGNATTLRRALCSDALRCGESLSLTASYAEYTNLTRAHIIRNIPPDHICAAWSGACHLLTRYVVQCAPAHLEMGSIGSATLNGVYVTRTKDADFAVGIITQCPNWSEDLPLILEAMERVIGYPVQVRCAVLPLGAGLREVKLSLWWTPNEARVTPGRAIPPLRVILTKPHPVCVALNPDGQPPPVESKDRRLRRRASGAPRRALLSVDAIMSKTHSRRDLFGGYSCVHAFLHRPVDSYMTGSVRLPVAHFSAQELVERFSQHGSVDGAAVGGEDGPPAADTGFGIRIEGDKVKAEVCFQDLEVTAPGEHFIMVEVEVEDAYRPFVPPLSAYLQPFLVAFPICGRAVKPHGDCCSPPQERSTERDDKDNSVCIYRCVLPAVTQVPLLFYCFLENNNLKTPSSHRGIRVDLPSHGLHPHSRFILRKHMAEASSLFCHGSATVMTDYHICRYDPVLGVLVCVGDDCDVLVLGKNMCRRRIPVRRGVHWLDCFLYAGTSSVLLLSPEGIECVDYQSCMTDTVLQAAPGGKLTCFHIPQGLTCGAVGRRDGTVSYFRLCDLSETEHQLFWTMKETNALELAAPFSLESSAQTTSHAAGDEQRFFPFGSLVSLDSLPENPNAFIGVIAGVSGVLEWSVGSGKVTTFFSAGSTLTNAEKNMLAVGKFTPGGNYVVATTTDSSQVLVWDMGQKKKGKVSSVYWVIDLSASIGHDLETSSVEAFQYNEYRVGMYMARTKSGGGSVSDKNSQWFLLLNGQRDIVEVVLRVEDKVVVDQEQVIADLNVYTARKGAEAKTRQAKATGGLAANFFKVFHVEPCAPHCYWHSELTDFDLDSLIITSSGGLHPLVVKRKRLARGLESIQELREIKGEAPWCRQSLLLRLPLPEQEAVMRAVATPAKLSAMDELLFGSSNLIDMYKKMGSNLTEIPEAKRIAANGAMLATVIGWGETVILSASTHQILRPDESAIANTSLWSILADQTSHMLLERALPPPATGFPAEVVLRVTVSAEQIMVTTYTIRLGVGRTVLALDRAAFGLPPGTGPMASVAKLVEAKMSMAREDGQLRFTPEGQCLVLVLEDSSIAFVDLSGVMDPQKFEPVKLLLPCATFLPAGARVCEVETFWGTLPALREESLYFAALLEGGRGVMVVNLSSMQMHLYPQFSTPAHRLLIGNASSAATPNMSGDIEMFSVDLAVTLPPTEPGECGEVILCDAAGGVLHSVQIGFGMTQAASREWCVRTSKDAAEVWHRTGFSLDVKRITLCCTLSEGGRVMHWKYGSDSGGDFTDDQQGTLKGVISCVRATWPAGKALLFTQMKQDTAPRRQVLAESAGPVKLASTSPILIMVGTHHLAAVDICATLRGGGRSAEDPTIRLDAARSLEDVLLCPSHHSLVALTRDSNGWRWINVMDATTLQPRMTPLATLDFAGEEQLKILQVDTDGKEVHLFLVGATHGAIGHYVLTTEEPTEVLSASVDPFWPPQYDPAPGSFRRYHRYLPRRPTQKAESNFFKRLMISPWEDIAEELVGTTFKQVKPRTSDSQQKEPEEASTAAAVPSPIATPKTSPTQQHVDVTNIIATSTAASISIPLTAKKNSPAPVPFPALRGSTQRYTAPAPAPASAPLAAAPSSAAAPAAAPGSRYAQLKALAQRENVSLTEARRMMSENVRKLQERAERLGAVADKSEEMASRAMAFQDLARQLKEKKRSSWL
eukprot:gene1578-961_t